VCVFQQLQYFWWITKFVFMKTTHPGGRQFY
jgi:hypothetical protein